MKRAARDTGEGFGKLAEDVREIAREDWRESEGERRRLARQAREAGASSLEGAKALLDVGLSELTDALSEALDAASEMFGEYLDSLRSGD